MASANVTSDNVTKILSEMKSISESYTTPESERKAALDTKYAELLKILDTPAAPIAPTATAQSPSSAKNQKRAQDLYWKGKALDTYPEWSADAEKFLENAVWLCVTDSVCLYQMLSVPLCVLHPSLPLLPLLPRLTRLTRLTLLPHLPLSVSPALPPSPLTTDQTSTDYDRSMECTWQYILEEERNEGGIELFQTCT
jgi:hypothetical protein